MQNGDDQADKRILISVSSQYKNNNPPTRVDCIFEPFGRNSSILACLREKSRGMYLPKG